MIKVTRKKVLGPSQLMSKNNLPRPAEVFKPIKPIIPLNLDFSEDSLIQNIEKLLEGPLRETIEFDRYNNLEDILCSPLRVED